VEYTTGGDHIRIPRDNYEFVQSVLLASYDLGRVSHSPIERVTRLRAISLLGNDFL
jgi:hypothetical protein